MGQEHLEQLVTGVAKGDRQALASLLLATHSRLLRYLDLRIPDDLRPQLDAEDLLQQVHIRAFRSQKRFQDQGLGAFLGWLQTIAEHFLQDEARAARAAKRGGGRRLDLRREGSDESLGDALEQLACHDHTPSRSAARHEAVERLQRALAGIPGRYREAIRLHYLERLPIREVAPRMGVSRGAVRMLCSRGLKELARSLGSASGFFSRAE